MARQDAVLMDKGRALVRSWSGGGGEGRAEELMCVGIVGG